MTSFLKGTNLPVFGEIADPKAKKNVKNVIRDLLNQPSTFDKVQPYLVNGGVCGHKVIDAVRIGDILQQADKDHRLLPFGLKDVELMHHTNGVLRERYTLDKHWKVVGLSKRVALTHEESNKPEPQTELIEE